MPRAVLGMAALLLFTISCSDETGPSDAAFFADRIAFSYVTDGGETRLATVNPDGSDVRDIALPASFKSSTIGGIVWTRDHSRLAFSAMLATGTHYDIFVIRPTGSTPVNITKTDDSDEGPAAWSPDGKQIVFERNGIISIINADGSNEHVLVGPNPSNSGNYYPDWSPDGTTIVYSTGYSDGIWTIDTSGSAEPVMIRGSAFQRGTPTWKPDGSRILFWEVSPTTPGAGALMTIAPDGSDPQTLSSTLVGYLPVWSPDGERIAVDGIQDPNVGFSVLNLATSGIVTWTFPGTRGSFAWK